MNRLTVASRLLPALLLGVLARTASATTTYTLSNGVAQLQFVQQGSAVGQSNLWLTSIKSSTGQTITLEQGLPLWIVETKRTPDPPAPENNDLSVVPENLPLVRVRTGIVQGTGKFLTATWGPAVVPVPAGWNNPPTMPQMSVVVTWTLPPGSDTASTTISVQILNSPATDYHLWLTRYPRVAVDCLDGDLNGSDRLAMGRDGGVLYGDPIHYINHEGGPLRLTQDPDHVQFLVSPDSTDPGILSIPASSYYDTENKLGLYHSNDDHNGYFKAIYWTQEPFLGTNGSLLVQTIQYATGDIYAATSYSSPYNVQLAALDNGDWIAAAQKYRSTWRGFTFYPGPVGLGTNHLVSPELKATPMALWLHSGDGYCINPALDAGKATTDLNSIASYFLAGMPAGTGFPLVYLDRYAVDVPHEVALGGYSQSNDMTPIHAFITAAEVAGHRTLIHGMTEKTFIPTVNNVTCDMFTACNYCGFLDPNLVAMCFANGLIKQPMTDPVGSPCPRGASWPGWFEAVNADFSNQLGSTGGLGWPSPNPTAGWCFSHSHTHDPGFDKFVAQGWLDILKNTAAGVGTTSTFARTMETSSAFFSQAAGIQNTWNFDVGYDYNHFQAGQYLYYANAPIWRIPMMQMAIDNAIYASVYSQQTLRYPFVPPDADQATAIFGPFPAMTGALACWSMAERVLTHQSVVYLNNEDMVPIANVSHPACDPVNNAAADMYGYYRGLAKFLMGTVPVSLIDYHTGSLERSPTLTMGGDPQTFVLSWATIAQYFPVLADGMMNVLFVTDDVDWSKYQPVRWGLSGNNNYGTIWMPVEPEANPTYLPNGMYRHYDGSSSLAFLITNPWGVKWRDPNDPCNSSVAMNPFTFTYGNPGSSPSTTYTYTFTFKPGDYVGFPGSSGNPGTHYKADLAVYNVDGSVASQASYVNQTGDTQFTSSLAPHQSAAWVFRPYP